MQAQVHDKAAPFIDRQGDREHVEPAGLIGLHLIELDYPQKAGILLHDPDVGAGCAGGQPVKLSGDGVSGYGQNSCGAPEGDARVEELIDWVIELRLMLTEGGGEGVRGEPGAAALAAVAWHGLMVVPGDEGALFGVKGRGRASGAAAWAAFDHGPF